MSKLFPILLIVVGLAVGIYGFSQFQDSGTSLSVGEVQISATDTGGRTQAYVLMGLGALGLVLGIGMMSKSKS